MTEIWVEPRWSPQGELIEGYFTIQQEQGDTHQMPTPEETKAAEDKAVADKKTADEKAAADKSKSDADPKDKSDKDSKAEYTPEYVAQLRRENAAARQKAETAETKLRELEDADLKRKGENEALATKAIKERDEAIAAAQKARDEARHTLIVSEARAYAAQKGAHDVNDVLRLIDLKDAKVSDDGSVTGVREQIDKAAESKAYLFKPAGDDKTKRPADWKGAPDNNGKVEAKTAFQMTDEEFRKEMADKFKVRI